jgi:WD40 repeat protein
MLLDVSFNPRHKWVAAGFGRGQYQGWMLWETQSQELAAARATYQLPQAIAMHPLLPQIAWLEAGALRILDVPSDEVRVDATLPLVADRLEYSPQGTWLAASKGAAIVVCDPESGNVVLPLDPRDQQPSGQPSPDFVGIDDDGRLLLLRRPSRRPAVKSSLLRRSADGKHEEVLIADLGNASCAFLSDDQQLLAVACDIDFQDGWQPTTIEVWDIAAAKNRQHFGGHWNQIEQMAFSADGKYLASSAKYTDVIKVWKLIVETE